MKKSSLIGISLLVVGVFFWFRFHDAKFCRGEPFDAVASPTGKRVAEKRNCSSNEYDDVQLFVRRTGIGYFFEPKRSIRLKDWNSVGYVWTNDMQLLVASPHVDDIADTTDHLGEIAVSYSVYQTTIPETGHDPSSFTTVRRGIQAGYRFKAEEGYALPGIGCSLYVEADAAPELKAIRLKIGANRVFQTKAWNAGHLVDMPEHIDSSIWFASASDYIHPIAFVTAAALDDIKVEEKGWSTAPWNRLRTPQSIPAIPWQIMWNINEPELQRALDKLRAGQFKIRIGYWFDNKEFIYASSAPGAIQPIEEFAQCVRNGIYPDLH